MIIMTMISVVLCTLLLSKCNPYRFMCKHFVVFCVIFCVIFSLITYSPPDIHVLSIFSYLTLHTTYPYHIWHSWLCIAYYMYLTSHITYAPSYIHDFVLYVFHIPYHILSILHPWRWHCVLYVSHITYHILSIWHPWLCTLHTSYTPITKQNTLQNCSECTTYSTIPCEKSSSSPYSSSSDLKFV